MDWTQIGQKWRTSLEISRHQFEATLYRNNMPFLNECRRQIAALEEKCNKILSAVTEARELLEEEKQLETAEPPQNR